MSVFSIVLHSLLVLYYLFSGFAKIAGVKYWADIFKRLGLPGWFQVVTGIVQVIGAAALIAGYWIDGAVPLAGIWLGITMLMACLAHLRVKDPFGKTAPALFFLALNIILVIVNADALQHLLS